MVHGFKFSAGRKFGGREKRVPFVSHALTKISLSLNRVNLVLDRCLHNLSTLDTVGVLARTIGAENFYPISEEWIHIGLVSFVFLLVSIDHHT